MMNQKNSRRASVLRQKTLNEVHSVFSFRKNDAQRPGFSQEWTPFSYVSGFFSRPQRKSAFILIYALFAVTLWAYIPQAPRLFVSAEAAGNPRPEDISSPDGSAVSLAVLDPRVENFTFPQRFQHLLENSQQIWGALFLFGLIPAGVVKFLFREKISDYGFSFGILRRTRNLMIMTVPVAIFAMYFAASTPYLSVYPYNPWILGGFSSLSEGYGFLFLYFFLYLTCYYLSWEFFFRGFLQIGTESTAGCFNAVLFGTILSTLAHLGVHPLSETLGAIAGGLLWGFFVYRSRSILAGWAMHASLGIALDFFLLYHFLP